MVEHLGGEQYLHVAVGPFSFVVQVSPERAYGRGDTVRLRMDSERLHWFRDGVRVG